ncbi:MAG: DUF368 domain-containing protein [Dehalococcoidia bacterium]
MPDGWRSGREGNEGGIDIKLKWKSESVATYFKGLVMGVADAIPGVSGGTFALILGIYTRLISSLSFFFANLKSPRKLFLSGDFRFLVTLLLGIVTGVLGLAHLMGFLLADFRVQTFSFFIGLILASVFFISKRVGQGFRAWLIVFSLAGFVIGFMVSGPAQVAISHSLIYVFTSGFLAICAMILPGISGAYILAILGQYEYMLSALTDFNIPVILVFIVGAALSLFLMSNFLKWLLSKYYIHTLLFLMGIMLGGLRGLFGESIASPGWMVLFIVVGASTLVVLEFLASGKDNSA